MRERTEYYFICTKRDSKLLSGLFIQSYLTDRNSSLIFFNIRNNYLTDSNDNISMLFIYS